MTPRTRSRTSLVFSRVPRGGAYFDLEQPAERLRLDLAWEGLVAGRRQVVLDEAQAWREVYARLRGAIDRDRGRKGRILLLGSVSPSLMTQVSESLAGRLSLVELTPFLWTKLTTAVARPGQFPPQA
ncbi:MAG: AAA family ATPase [Planctomycetes bacterium]|nr:AAA family ATPase [Planctomycetota bacterium]